MTLQQCKNIKAGTLIKSKSGSYAVVEASSDKFPNAFCGWCIKEYGNELYIKYSNWEICTKEEVEAVFNRALEVV